jgi:S1-C subfamily serine protease
VEVTLAKFQVPEKLGKPFFTRKPPALGGLRVDYTSILAQRPTVGLWGGGVLPGVVIREVQARSAAEAARLQVDKVITHVDGERVNDPTHFYKLMEAAKAKGAVELTLYTSDGRPDKVKIDLR